MLISETVARCHIRHVILDNQQKALLGKNNRIPCYMKYGSTCSCCRVSVEEDVVIERNSEVVVSANDGNKAIGDTRTGCTKIHLQQNWSLLKLLNKIHCFCKYANRRQYWK